MTSFREYRNRPEGATPGGEVVSVLPKGAAEFQGERAGFVSRTLAATIDVVLIFAVVLGTVAALWMLSFIIDPGDSSSAVPVDTAGRVPPIAWFIAYGYWLNWLYWTVCWALSGRTLGNLVMGLRVVNRQGEHLRWGGAALRSLFCTTFPFGLFWVIVSGANRSVQDVVLRTSVIYDWSMALPPLAGAIRRRSETARDV